MLLVSFVDKSVHIFVKIFWQRKWSSQSCGDNTSLVNGHGLCFAMFEQDSSTTTEERASIDGKINCLHIELYREFNRKDKIQREDYKIMLLAIYIQILTVRK